MATPLSAQAWWGLIVYFVVMGFVIKGQRIPVHKSIAKRIVKLFTILRLRDTPIPSPAPSTGSSNNAILESSESIQLASIASIASISRSSTTLDVKECFEDPLITTMKISLDLRTAPVLGVILLLITRTIDVSVLHLGIVGGANIRPYDVLVLFISLAYISTALDAAGALRALAFFISQKAAQLPKLSTPSADKVVRGSRLYVLLYVFWFLLGSFVGNDPIVLSGTAFLAYFTRVTGVTIPTAWIYSQFYAANIASAILVSSNPTNVLIAGAFDLNFLTGYSKYTVLPSLVTAIVAFFLTFFTFYYLKPPSRDAIEPFRPSQAYIPVQLIPPDVSPRSVLIDPCGAIFHSILMTITLLLLVGTSFVPGGVEVWIICLPAGMIALLRDLITEWRSHKSITAPVKQGLRRYSLPSFINSFTQRLPTSSHTITHLPISLLPFAGGIFILARSLVSLGWTTIWSGWLSKICTSPITTVFFLGYFISLTMCPLLGTNIGATILIIEVLLDSNFTNSPQVLADPKIMKGAIYSTALASNLGAFSFSFSSSLAGLLWVKILRQKGIIVRSRDFASWNLLFLPVLSTVASSVIVLQLYYFD